MKNTTFLRGAGLAVILFISLSASSAHASAPSDIHITSDGKFTATNVIVFQKASNNVFFTRVTWSDTFLRVTILTHADTVITKAHGEKATGGEVSEGDILQVEGVLSSGNGGLIVDAKKVIDTSLQIESKVVSGTVKSVSGSSFVLPNKVFGDTTTVLVGTSTIQKGVRNIAVSDLRAGDKILSVEGAYNYSTNALSATSIRVYQDQAVFLQRNFQGILKSLSGTTLPITATIAVDGANYTVSFASGTTILNNAKTAASLSRFVVGDTVRFYGSIRPTNLTEIDASVFRDINF